MRPPRRARASQDRCDQRVDIVRMWSRLGRSALIALILAGLLQGCVEHDGALTIVGARPLDPNSDDCLASDKSDIFLLGGVLDISMASRYVLFPVIRNDLMESGFNIDMNRVLLQKAIVTYTPQAPISARFPDDLPVLTSGSINSSGSTLVSAIEVVTPAMVAALRNASQFVTVTPGGNLLPKRSNVTLLVHVKFIGESLDGTRIESNEFSFPLTVCNGCLSIPPAPNPDSAGVQISCFDTGTLSDNEAVNCPAYIGQDYPVDCRVCTQYAHDPVGQQVCR